MKNDRNFCSNLQGKAFIHKQLKTLLFGAIWSMMAYLNKHQGYYNVCVTLPNVL